MSAKPVQLASALLATALLALAALAARGIPFTSRAVGGMFGFFFTEQAQVNDFAGATACDGEKFKAFYHAMLDRGVYLAPSAFEAGFVSAAHSDEDIAGTVEAARQVFVELA